MSRTSDTHTERLLLLVARPTPSGVDERSLRALRAAVAARTPLPVPAIAATGGSLVPDGELPP